VIRGEHPVTLVSVAELRDWLAGEVIEASHREEALERSYSTLRRGNIARLGTA
jgi:hypothetical protein